MAMRISMWEGDHIVKAMDSSGVWLKTHGACYVPFMELLTLSTKAKSAQSFIDRLNEMIPKPEGALFNAGQHHDETSDGTGFQNRPGDVPEVDGGIGSEADQELRRALAGIRKP